MPLPLNPYVAGNPVGDSPAFIGRADVLREVTRMLRRPQGNGIVLFGQRRIGKTSILQHLEARLPGEGPYGPVYFDLQDKADWSLDRVLLGLARTVTHALDQPDPDLGDDPETSFRQEWLPTVLDDLPEGCSLVLLFDEFDVLADPQKEQAAAAFFPYLRGLLASDPERLQFVFVIGRNVDDLDTIALSLFRGTPYQRVSLLSREDTAELVRLSEQNGTLTWPDETVERVWQLTNGHPFLTQQLCSHVWERAYDESDEVRRTLPADVDAAVSDALDASRNTLEWLWDGLPPAERVVASALAEAGPAPITQDGLEQLLHESGVRVVIRELQNAPRLLQDWDLIEPADGGYRFRVELLRRWLAEHKPLSRVQEELDRIEPVAESLYRAALGMYRGGQLDQAVGTLRQAIGLNPNHMQANQLLADILLAQGQANEARQLLERLHEYQPAAARSRLTQALLAQAETVEPYGERIALYERVLEIEPNNPEVIRVYQDILHRSDALLSQREWGKAERLLDPLYKYLPEEIRPRLVEALLAPVRPVKEDVQPPTLVEQILDFFGKGSKRGQSSRMVSLTENEQLDHIKRVLELNPDHPEAIARWQCIWKQRGDSALEADDLETAQEAYEIAGLTDKVAEVKQERHRRDLAARLRELEALGQEKRYQDALDLVRKLSDEYPEAREWKSDVERLERKKRLSDLYQSALGALQSGDRKKAQNLLVQVVALEPGYEEATRYLHLVVTGVDVAELQARLGVEEKGHRETEALAARERVARRQSERNLQDEKRARQEDVTKLQAQLEAERKTRAAVLLGSPPIFKVDNFLEPMVGQFTIRPYDPNVLGQPYWPYYVPGQPDYPYYVPGATENQLTIQPSDAVRSAESPLAPKAKRALSNVSELAETPSTFESEESPSDLWPAYPYRLSPWNPRDQLSMDERTVGMWLTSTLTWLPLLIPTLALGMRTLPRTEYVLSFTAYLWISLGLALAWVLTGWLGEKADCTGLVVALGGAGGGAVAVTLGVVGDMALIVVGIATSIALLSIAGGIGEFVMGVVVFVMAFNVALVIVKSAVGGIALVVTFVLVSLVAGFVMRDVIGTLRTGQPSWLARVALGALLLVYAFLIWFSFLDGWQMFQ